MDINIEQAAAYLKDRDDYLVVSHASPDADTIGSAAALVTGLRSIGKNAVAVCYDRIPDKLSFLDSGCCFTETEPKGIKTYISVDTASAVMLGGLAEKYTKERVFDLAIDHHIVNNIPCRQRLLFADYSSCGEIIFELLEKLGIPLDKSTATSLYGAMSSDSGGFRFSSTRPQTMRHAARLMETGIDFAKINRLLFETKTLRQIEIERIAYNSVELYYDGRLAVVTITADHLLKANADESDIEGLSQIPRQISGVEVSAVIRPKGDTVKVSLRSNDYFNVAELASRFGGGGHHHAAGCSFDTDTDHAKEAIIDSLKGLL